MLSCCQKSMKTSELQLSVKQLVIITFSKFNVPRLDYVCIAGTPSFLQGGGGEIFSIKREGLIKYRGSQFGPPFLKRGKLILTIFLGGQRNLKDLKSWVKVWLQEQVFLKEGGWHFCNLIFSMLVSFICRNYFTLCKTVLCI